MKIKHICKGILMHGTTAALSLALILGTAGGAFGKANSQSSGGIVASAATAISRSGEGKFLSGGHTYTYRYRTDVYNKETFELLSITVANRSVSIPSRVYIDGKYRTINTIGYGFGKGITAETVTMPDTITDIKGQVFQDARIGTVYVSSAVKSIGNYFCSSPKIDRVVYNGSQLESLGSCAFSSNNQCEYYGLKPNSHGAVIFGDWLIRYIGGEKSISIIEIGEEKKITKLGPYCFNSGSNEKNLNLERVDLSGVDTIANGVFRKNPNITELTGASSISSVDSWALNGAKWYDERKDNNLVMLGQVLLYYHTDYSTIDLSDYRFNNIKYVNPGAIYDCKNASILKLNPSIERFADSAFVGTGSSRAKKISTVYVGNKKIVYDNNDQFLPKPLANSLYTFRESPYVKQFTKDKTKGILACMGFSYYGGNIGNALSRNTQYQIAYKIHEYVVTNYYYDYNSQNYLDAFLSGKCGMVCEDYAQLYAYLLESAGVNAEVVSSCVRNDNGKVIYNGDHAWNLIKIGSQWYHADVCWDSCNYADKLDFNMRWFLVSDEFIKKETCCHAMWQLETDCQFNNCSSLPRCDSLLGDADGNGYRNKDDATIIQRYLIQDTWSMSNIKLSNTDTNFDGKVNMPDAINAMTLASHRSKDPLSNYGNHTAKAH